MPSVRMLDSALATYAIAQNQVNPAAAATDWTIIIGSTGKVIKIRYIEVAMTGAAKRVQPVGIIKRSTLNTTGTRAAVTPTPVDSNDAVASATPFVYSVNAGALGTSQGQIDGGNMNVNIVATDVITVDRVILNYEQGYMKPPQLNNSNETLAVNFNVGGPVATIATDKIDNVIWWTEQ